MTFRENASLKTNQVRRGGGGGRRRPGGGSMAAGGGVGGVLLLILYLVFGEGTGGVGGISDGGLAQGSGWDYTSQYVEQADGSDGDGDFTEQFPECQTGEDANERVDCRMVGTVISVQDYWGKTYRDYEPAQTVLFSGSVNTGCGAADSSVGPFYCPVDSTIYLDVSFFNQLDAMGGDGGSLSQMYVVAHEYGHHIQNLTGSLARSQQDRQGPESGAVRVELQADCFAGVWVANASQTVDEGGQALLEPVTQEQIDSALSGAEAVGDDRIQAQAQGRINPDVWTHGSAEQRQRWFLTGYESGDPTSCDTFNTDDL